MPVMADAWGTQAVVRLGDWDCRMGTTTISGELRELGPNSAQRNWSLAESQAYCRQLAQSHYENFRVASWLLPRELRQHFYHAYAYCRWSDDLADETEGGAASLALLDWWEDELRDCYRGRASHPVFVALRETIDEFAIPMEPFADLLVAFRQDQVTTRYTDRQQLLEYCRYSANPVGRLVLHLGRCATARHCELADSICSGLQLANFWQDVARDWQMGRRYLPAATMRAHGVTDAMFASARATPEFRAALADEVAQAEQMLLAGAPLVGLMPAALRLDVWLFVQGGLAILQKIRRQQFDVWSARPALSKREHLWLLVKGYALARLRRLSPGGRA